MDRKNKSRIRRRTDSPKNNKPKGGKNRESSYNNDLHHHSPPPDSNTPPSRTTDSSIHTSKVCLGLFNNARHSFVGVKGDRVLPNHFWWFCLLVLGLGEIGGVYGCMEGLYGWGVCMVERWDVGMWDICVL